MNTIQAFRPRGLEEVVLVRNVVCLSAVVCLLWEYALTFEDEYKYIWKGSMNRVKALYLFARYSTLALHIANVFFVFGPLSNVPVPRNGCIGWFLMLTVGGCLLLASIDSLIMLRVHILYNRSWAMGIFLASLLVVQGALVATCTSRTLHLVSFSSTCDILETPHDVVYIMAGVIFTQVVLLFLTIAKRRVAFGASPVVHIVVHDGARVFVLIVSMWVTIIPYSLFIQVSKPHIIFVWPIVLMSIATCRLIMHMHKLPLEVLARDEHNRTPGATDDASIILTSYIATLESFHAAAGLGLGESSSTISSNCNGLPTASDSAQTAAL